MGNKIRAYKPLQVADFTVINLGTHAVANQCNSVAMSGGAGIGASNLTLLVKALPVSPSGNIPPYTVTLHCKDYQLGAAYYGYGLCWRDNYTGKILGNVCYSGGSIYSNTSRVVAYANPTTYQATYTLSSDMIWYPEWFRIRDDLTNLYSYISSDGVNWHLLYTLARTAFLSPNQVGFFIDPYSAAAVVLFDSFSIDEHA